MYISVYTSVKFFLMYSLGSRITWSNSLLKSFFSFTQYCQNALQSGCVNFYSDKKSIRVFVSNVFINSWYFCQSERSNFFVNFLFANQKIKELKMGFYNFYLIFLITVRTQIFFTFNNSQASFSVNLPSLQFPNDFFSLLLLFKKHLIFSWHYSFYMYYKYLFSVFGFIDLKYFS